MSKPLTLIEGQKCICPHCQYKFEDPIQDFVIPLTVGPASKYDMDCDECGETFSVQKNLDGTFTVK